ncbi:hypothetical protein UFOVP231_13 [uncultured Caudovirales phage]|uniref:Uncharacterized protein n=1 Tax=uncultured Caudovirales phage TaxID=2100421 RepID=A0A6J7WT97_9CAUD|nr:hypothetical protein UFOVP231_13 [uncultured Caudovirales phage]
MSDTEEKIEFKLEDDAPKVEASKEGDPVVEIVDEPVEPGQEKAGKDVDKALKKLNKKLEKERARRAEAENIAKQAAEHARMATNEASDSNLHLVSGAIESVRRDQEILKSHLRDSMAVGDYDKAAAIQEQMSANIENLRRLERGFEEMKQQPRLQPPPVQNEITVDTLINQVTPKSAEWLRENKKHLPDARSIRVMARAHEDAVDYGIVPESAAYFKFVENRLGIEKNRRSIPEVEEVMSGASSAKQKRSGPPSAPVSRQPIDSPNRQGVIHLTAAEVEAAKISGISPQEYYRNKMREQNR